VTIWGRASGKKTHIDYSELDLEEILLNWLRSKGVTIASSCDGEGVCKRCTIQNDWLTCEMTLEMFLRRCPEGIIEVSYL
jgi:uncharacterized 2Fe-2S/4Fe-4S cluster protein (DUF4445 family)